MAASTKRIFIGSLIAPAVLIFPLIVDPAAAVPPCFQQRITAGDAATFDNFGWAAAVSASAAIVGAKWDDDLGMDSGSAYVFKRQRSAWMQIQKLLPSDGSAGNGFGFSVAIDGTVAVIGSPSHTHPGGPQRGAAYVFRFNGTQWAQEAELLASDGALHDGFGRAVAIRGDVAIVGADLADPMGSSSGAAYVFRYNAVTQQWAQEQKLQASDGQTADFFGTSVALEGELAFIGAVGDGDVAFGSGAAYVFRYDGVQWIQEQKLLPDSIGAFLARFGASVSISNAVALAGAYGQTNGSATTYGAVHFFQHDGTQWVRTQKIVGPDTWTRQFGKAVCMDGPLAVVGAWSSIALGPETGAAYVYRFNPASKLWVQQGPALLPTIGGGPFFGFSVGLSGTTAVVGAYGESQQRGAAYIYNVNPPTGDLTCDGLVNTLDLGIVLSNWSIPPTGPGCDGDSPCPADLNGDGLVNTLDLGILLSNWTLK